MGTPRGILLERRGKEPVTHGYTGGLRATAQRQYEGDLRRIFEPDTELRQDFLVDERIGRMRRVAISPARHVVLRSERIARGDERNAAQIEPACNHGARARRRFEVGIAGGALLQPLPDQALIRANFLRPIQEALTFECGRHPSGRAIQRELSTCSQRQNVGGIFAWQRLRNTVELRECFGGVPCLQGQFGGDLLARRQILRGQRRAQSTQGCGDLIGRACQQIFLRCTQHESIAQLFRRLRGETFVHLRRFLIAPVARKFFRLRHLPIAADLFGLSAGARA